MWKSKLAAVLLCVALVLTSCARTNPDASMKANAAESAVEMPQDAQPDKAFPDEMVISTAWQNLSADIDVSNGATAVSISVAGDSISFSDREDISVKDAVQIGASGEFDTTFVILTKYEGVTLRVYEVDKSDGGPFFPNESGELAVGDLVWEQTNPSGQYILKIPCLVDAEYDYYRFGYQYKIQLDGGLHTIEYYPIHGSARDYGRSSSIKAFSNFQPLGNPKKEYQPPASEQTKPVAEKAAPSEDIDYSQLSPVTMPEASYTITLLEAAESEQIIALAGKDTVDKLYQEYLANTETSRGNGIADVFEDSLGRYYICNDWDEQAPGFVLLFSEGALSQLDTASANYAGLSRQGSTLHELSDGYFLLHTLGDAPKTLLVQPDTNSPGFPFTGGLQEICWITNEAFSMNQPEQSVLLGVLSPVSAYRFQKYPPQAYEYVVLRKTPAGFAQWFRTDTVQGYPGEYFPEMMVQTIATPNGGQFTQPQPVQLTLLAGIAELNYPNSCTTVSCDFGSRSLTYATSYNKEFLALDSSTLVCSSFDERYQIWKINERWMHESTSYSYAVYDTVTASLHDFGLLEENIRLSFADDTRVAIIKGVESKPYDSGEYGSYTQWVQECYSQQVTLLDITTGEQHPLRLELGDLSWAHTLWSYLWDPVSRRHYLLSVLYTQPADSTIHILNPEEPVELNKYALSIFEENGIYLGTYQTSIPQFGGWFDYYLPDLSLMEEGNLFLKNPLGENQYQDIYHINLSDGSVKKALYLQEEYDAIDKLIDNTDEPEAILSAIDQFLLAWSRFGGDGVLCMQYLASRLEAAPDAPASAVARVLIPGEVILTGAVGRWETLWHIDKEVSADREPPVNQYHIQFRDEMLLWSPGEDDEDDIIVYYSAGKIGFIWYHQQTGVQAYVSNWNAPVMPYSISRRSDSLTAHESHNYLFFDSYVFTGLKVRVDGDRLICSYYNDHLNQDEDFLYVNYQHGILEAAYPDAVDLRG